MPRRARARRLAPVAVLPCCHDEELCDSAGLKAWMDVGMAVDAVRVLRLRGAGYQVYLRTIPAEIEESKPMAPLPCMPTSGELMAVLVRITRCLSMAKLVAA